MPTQGQSQNVIPLYDEAESFYVPYFEIKLKRRGQQQGDTLPRTVIRDIMEVSYEDSVEKIDSFTLTVNNWDADRRAFKYVGMTEAPAEGSESAAFNPGNEFELYMGYRNNLRLMMTGFVTTIEPDFPESGAPKLTVKGLNVLDRLRQKQYTWSWETKPDSEITDSKIARELGRPPDDRAHRPGLVDIDEVRANNQEQPENYVLMNNQYPIVFLLERARRHGYEVFVSEEMQNGRLRRILYFGPSQNIRDVTYRLDWGKTLVSFRPSLTTSNQVAQVTVYGWNRRTRRRIEKTVKLEELRPPVNQDLYAIARAANRTEVITDRPVHSENEAKQIAEDALRRQVLGMVETNGVTVGLPDLRAGRAVVIGNVGYQFNGRYFIKETTHTINDSGYRTTFRARREHTERSSS